MNKLRLWLSENSVEEDILSVYRERLMLRFAIFFTALFSVLMIFNLVNQYNVLGAALGAGMVIAALNVAAIHFKKSVSPARAALIMWLAVLVGIALLNRGTYGTFWTFPILIFISFSVPHKLAKIYSTLFFLYISALTFYLLDPGFALRAVVGLFITLRFINIFLRLIEKLQLKLIEQSTRDPLTNAFNRRQMMTSLEEAVERKRRTEAPASLLIFDIDDFKSINDNYGHSVGDHVLKKFVALVDDRARRFDRLFRIGGEEFMLFLPDTSETGALQLAEQFRISVSEAAFIEGRRVTVSIGLSELKEGETIDAWMKHADNALYAAKENGRNRVYSRAAAAAATFSDRSMVIENRRFDNQTALN